MRMELGVGCMSIISWLVGYTCCCKWEREKPCWNYCYFGGIMVNWDQLNFKAWSRILGLHCKRRGRWQYSSNAIVCGRRDSKSEGSLLSAIIRAYRARVEFWIRDYPFLLFSHGIEWSAANCIVRSSFRVSAACIFATSRDILNVICYLTIVWSFVLSESFVRILKKGHILNAEPEYGIICITEPEYGITEYVIVVESYVHT